MLTCQKIRHVIPLLLLSSVTALVSAEEPLEYNRDILPILADNCFACHGVDSAARKADLRLDQREAALESGAIVEQDPDESELIARILSEDPDSVMPPPETKKKVTAEQVEKLRRWIARGAEYQAHWSLLTPHRTEPSEDDPWVKNFIDLYVLAKLKAVGLQPNPEANPRRLFRRLHLDTTGLPPTPEDVAQFEQDYVAHAEKALSDWIDRLMDLPAWGEHRARYWLDAARYGDTHGLHFDNYREMWPYRDWVIRAFNANQPFDQFTIEQLAGDLLPEPTDDQLIATGFQRCNITTNEGGTIDEENLANYASDRVQTFGWVYLGLTTNCCQCHDHKFDRLTMQDYYSLAAYFRNTTQGPKDGNVKDGRGPVLIVPTGADRERWDVLPQEIAAARTSRDERRKHARPLFEQWLAEANPDSLEEAISTSELVVHLPLNEGSGNSVSAQGEDAPTFKAAAEVTWAAGGKLGSAPQVKPGATFDLGGLGDFEKDQSFSYGAWVKAGDNRVSGGILARMDEKSDYRGWDLWQQGRTVGVHIIDKWPENGLKVVTQKEVLKAGEWQHVFATYDGSGKPSGVRIYVNGVSEKLRVEKDALAQDATIRTDTPLRVGQRSNGQFFTNGALQDLRIYQRVLEPAEVRSIADIYPLREILATPAEKRTDEQKKQLFENYLTTQDAQFSDLERALRSLEAEREAIRGRSPVTHIQKEKMNSPAMAYILERGEYDRKTRQVSAATPAALHPLPEDAPDNRLGLARWVVDPANPLTARVTVNRFWQQVFGQGIVATPEDFGVMGMPPSHPELLDRLAVEFVERGWDVKQLFKLMLMSATYRQSAVTTPEKLEKDRDNVLLSRGPRFRIDAEMVRDYALASSGLLSRKMYGPSVKPYQPVGIWDIVGLPGGNTRNYVADKGEDLYRRTLYSFWKRMAPPPNLEAFNAPSREVCTVRRERTNTPLQALVTLNDPQFVEAARHLAQRALQHAGRDSEVLDFIALQVLGRELSQPEQQILLADKQVFLEYYQAHAKQARSLVDIGETKADEKQNVVILAAWTMVCNQVMNLDEALNK